jgi:serine/threonine protein kinase/WD40 repeat protein
MSEQEIYIEALDRQDPADRQRYLEQACASKPILRERLVHLLRQSEQLGSFMVHPPVDAVTATPGEPQDVRGVADATSRSGDGSTVDIAGNATFAADPTNDAREDQGDDILLRYLQPSSEPGSLGRLGHYEILAVIGQGAFGTVLRAFDEKLHRVVAIKVLTPEMAATTLARKRFLREARTAAAVRHENVVSIYGVEENPIPYLVMEYVPGKTLQQLLDDDGPLSLPDVLRLGKQIANGMAAAHAEDLIHRDVKPCNILLEDGPEQRLKITDFGLARTLDDATMTQDGLIAGTPMYMAPEQAHGDKLDQRADLFSFGSVLYQMLSGRPPFPAPSTLAVLKRVTEDTPGPIQEIVPEVPDWMCNLIGHLHAKHPDDRYGSARELSELLGQCAIDLQAGRVPQVPDPSTNGARRAEESPDAGSNPIQPRRGAALRHRPLLKIATVLLITLGVLGVTEATGVTSLNSTVIRLVTGAGTLVIETDDPRVKIAIDGEQVTIRGGGVEELTLRPGEYKVAATKDGKTVEQQLVTITRNGRTTVRISLEGDRRIVQSADKTSVDAAPKNLIVKRMLRHPGPVVNVVFSPDSRLLASGGMGFAYVWNAGSGVLRYTLPVTKGELCSAIAFSPDGKYLLTAPGGKSIAAPINIWNSDTGKPSGVLEGHTKGLMELSFSKDGKTLLSCGWDHFVRVWDFAARRQLRDIPSPTDSHVMSAVFSSTGKIAFGSDKVFLAEPNGKLIRTIDEPSTLLRFSPDGRRLVGTNTKGEGFATAWDVETGGEIASWHVHKSVFGLAFSPGGNVIATAGYDEKVLLWDINTQRQLAELSNKPESYGTAFSADGMTLATTGYEPLVRLWDMTAILKQQKEAARGREMHEAPIGSIH